MRDRGPGSRFLPRGTFFFPPESDRGGAPSQYDVQGAPLTLKSLAIETKIMNGS